MVFAADKIMKVVVRSAIIKTPKLPKIKVPMPTSIWNLYITPKI